MQAPWPDGGFWTLAHNLDTEKYVLLYATGTPLLSRGMLLSKLQSCWESVFRKLRLVRNDGAPITPGKVKLFASSVGPCFKYGLDTLILTEEYCRFPLCASKASPRSLFNFEVRTEASTLYTSVPQKSSKPPTQHRKLLSQSGMCNGLFCTGHEIAQARDGDATSLRVA